jgi:hypothetical protein
MKNEVYLLIQKLIQEIEEDNQTAKLILFFENGKPKAIEFDKKIQVKVE